MGKKLNLQTGEVTEFTLTEQEKLERQEFLLTRKLKKRNEDFEQYKAEYLNQFRNLQLDVQTGLDEPLTQEEINWYKLIKTYEPKVGEEFPEVPERIKNFE